MPFCENCGKKVSDAAKFCNNCGTNLSMLNSDIVTIETAKIIKDKFEKKPKQNKNIIKEQESSLHITKTLDEQIISNTAIKSNDSQNVKENEKAKSSSRKHFYSGFWFWFWAILALFFFIASFSVKEASLLYILIIVMYVIYNGIVKKESWWGDTISNMLSKRKWRIVLIVLFILFFIGRALIISLKE